LKVLRSFLITAAAVIITGCASVQTPAQPEAGSTQAAAEPAAETQEQGAVAEVPGAQTEGQQAETNNKEETSAAGGTAAAKPAKKVETVTIVIPTVYESLTTQEEADQIKKKNGYESAVLNEDGSLEIVMSKTQHQEMLGQYKKAVDEGIAEIIKADEDSVIEKIEYNDEYSVFTVTVKGDEIGVSERLAADELIMYGTLYHIYSGNSVDRIQVNYVNSGTGEVIETADSGSLEEAY